MIARVALLLVLVCCPVNIIGLWWAVGSPLALNRNAICRKSRRLASGGRQREMCRQEPEIVAQVSRGVQIAVHECQYQFRQRRWNCDPSKRSISKVLTYDTRETAFVHAVTSAAVLHAVTAACSHGALLQCSCDHTYRDAHNDGKWEWGGCNDNVNYGYIKSKEFLDIRPRRSKKNDMRNKMQLHNNEAGRKAVTDFIEMVCKCHGLSGSCNLKTCWRKMAPLRDVSTRLKESFDGAVKVSVSNDGRRLIPAAHAHPVTTNNKQTTTTKPPAEQDLVYSMDSPDYCEPNRSIGSLGTARRTCTPGSLGTDGCDLLCCSRGYKSRKVVVAENCNCRFHWCCEVVCQTCNVTRYTHRCRGYK